MKTLSTSFNSSEVRTCFISFCLFWWCFLYITSQSFWLERISLLFQDFHSFSFLSANVASKKINFMSMFGYLCLYSVYLQNWTNMTWDFLILIYFYIILLRRPYFFVWIYKFQVNLQLTKNDLYLNNRLYFFYLFYFIKKIRLLIFILLLLYFFFYFNR